MADFMSIEVTGLGELQALLDRAAQRLQNPHDLLDALGAVYEQQVVLRFETKTDPSGAPWEPLADSTRERYDRADTGKSGGLRSRGSLLERTRQMLDSLNHVASDDHVDVGMNRLTDDGTWQIPLLHETGTEHMPRRGIFLADWQAGTLGADDERALLAEAAAWLDALFGPGG